MIVSCPSCHTRYRHDPGPVIKAATAECSHCEETFPLAEPRRTYVLMPPATADGVATMPCPVEGHDGAIHTDVESRGSWKEGWRWEALELGIALTPSALGGIVAYYLAGQQNQDPVTWSALGGAGGLLLGWVGLLWMQRKR